MKKIYIACAVLATAALTSCLQEQSFNDVKLSENDVVFTFQGAASTKAAEAPVQRGVSIPLGKDGSHSFTLVETVTDLNDWSPATKGTPAYTENVGTLYANDLFVTATGFGDATFENMDGDRVNGGWRYRHTYDKSYWPADASEGAQDAAVDFYLQMPSAVTSYGVSARPSYSNGAISFAYTSPTTAEEQRDLIFAHRSLTKAEHNGYLPYGAPVLFHHALTGVKFRISNDAEDRESKGIVKITSVTFVGLKNTGNCVVTPRKEAQPGKPVVDEDGNPVVDEEGNPTTEPQDPDYIDNRTGDYSSGDQTLTTGTVAWTGTSTTSATNRIGQSFNESDIRDFTSGDGNNFAPSYYEAGTDQNLNAADGSYTFWLIPQSFTDTDVELEIEYVVSDEETGQLTKEITIPFGSILAENNVTWMAGQLRTYSIQIDEVNVKIEDTVTLQNATAAGQYKGSTKQNVVITNTGDTDTYIRAAIIGQWLDIEGNPVFGFTDFTAPTEAGQFVLVDSWYQDQFGTGTGHGQHLHGAFQNLVGYKNDNADGSVGTTVYSSTWWTLGSDGYYYFNYVVPAGKAVPTQDGTATKYIKVTANGTEQLTGGAPLFESYTIKDAPDARVAGQVQTIFFELEIATQAVSAKKTDGSYYTLKEAWQRAGITVE